MTIRLDGDDAVLVLDGDRCRVRFRIREDQGWLRRRLREIVVPVHALVSVEIRPPGLFRAGRLTLVPREGADPFGAVAADALPDDQSPYVIEFGSAQESRAGEIGQRLRAMIGTDVPAAGEFMIEPPGPPVRARGGDVVAEFDGTRVTLRRPEPYTVPLATLRSVIWVDRRDRRCLRFVRIGDAAGVGGPEGDAVVPGTGGPAVLPFGSDEERAETLLLGAAVAVALQRFQRSAGTHGLQVTRAAGGAVLRLYGLDATAEFDGTAVTITGQGPPRRIPLAAIDHVELGEAGDLGFVRVHLAGADGAGSGGTGQHGMGQDGAGSDGAGSHADPFEPFLDVNSVCHTNEQAALEFTLDVMRALAPIARKPDRELVATSGPREDIAGALARGSARVRGMVPELVALSAVLEPEERLHEVDLAVRNGPGLLALTDDRLLFFAADDPGAEPHVIPLRRVGSVRVGRREGRLGELGELVVVLPSGRETRFGDLHHPVRFRDGCRRLAERAVERAAANPAPPVVARVVDPPRVLLRTESIGRSPAPEHEDSSAAQEQGQGAGPVDGGVERIVLRAGREVHSKIRSARRLIRPGIVQREDLTEALRRAGTDTQERTQEILALLPSLGTGERVHEIEAALLDGQSGLAVLTDRRLLFQGKQEGREVELYRIREVTAYGLLGELNVVTDFRARLQLYRMRGVERFADAIKELMVRPPPGDDDAADDPPEPLDPAEPAEASEVLDTIRRLGELHAAGLLTDAEFEQKKAELLGRL